MSKDDDNVSRLEDVVIARIIKPRGIRGEVACSIETDLPERFESLKDVTLLIPDQKRLSLKIESHWFHKGRVVLKFQGYDSIDAAQKLVGARVVISESDAVAPVEGQFFERHLIGCEVVSVTGQRIGPVVSLLRTGGTDLLVVDAGDGRERLIPFADEICTEVDLQAKQIIVDPPEGLLEL